MKPGSKGKISYINIQDSEVLKRLISMGVLPGNEIVFLHRFPSSVFQMGKSTFAIDKELAEDIFVLLLEKE